MTVSAVIADGLGASRYTRGVRASDNFENSSASPRRGILAIDYGRARIGLAIADAQAGLARPFGSLERINRNEDMRRLRQIVREQGIQEVVVGLPLRLDGTRGEMAEEAARLAARVRKQLGVPVKMIDERLTSWEAERLLEERLGRMRKPPKRVGKRTELLETHTVDAMAAAVILQEYLRQRAKETEPALLAEGRAN